MGIPTKANTDDSAGIGPACRRTGFLVAFACLLGACAHHPAPTRIGAILPLASLPEPAAREVVVVINANSFAGSHAGLFAGSRLYDPSGSYAGKRAEDRAWRGPGLADYVKFHLADGPDVRLYRFALEPAEFERILVRIDKAGWALPMFCAEDVQDVLAGVGPFKGLEAGRWTSPVRLGERLEAVVPTALVKAECGNPEAQPC